MTTGLMGHTATAAYLSNPTQNSRNCYGGTLPALASIHTPRPGYESVPTSAPLTSTVPQNSKENFRPWMETRSHTTMDWRPSNYHSSRVAPKSASVLRNSIADPQSYSNQLSRVDPLRAPSIITAARQALYTRYSPNEWQRSNGHNYMSSDKVRSMGERLRLDAARLAREMEERTRNAQTESGKRIGDRLHDIDFWRRELANEAGYMNAEMNQLTESKRVLEKALNETNNPLQIAQECLFEREKRQGIDLVHDNVERSLLEEVDAIRRSQESLRSIMEKSNTQLSLDRSALHELEKDNRDKFIAESLDNSAHQLQNTSRGIAFHNGVERQDHTTSTPETWARYTHDNVQRSQAERSHSKQLRADIEKALETAANEMWAAWNRVNIELTRRIQESSDARNRLQQHLGKVVQEISDMEKNIQFLKKSIEDKENPLKVAQSRLEVRGHRPNVELSRDPAQHRLVEEVHELYNSVDQLHMKLRESENALQHMLLVKSNLEQDLSVKNNSIFLDRERCMSMRKSFPMAPRVVGY